MANLPSIEKIPEAYSVIADGRIEMGEGTAKVYSSDRSKFYTVKWRGDTYSSNDNSSYWHSVIGYPIIAVLMKQGKLPLDLTVADKFRDIPWNKLNKRFGNNYSEALSEAYRNIAVKGINLTPIQEAIKICYTALSTLDIVIKRGSIRPPKANNESES